VTVKTNSRDNILPHAFPHAPFYDSNLIDKFKALDMNAWYLKSVFYWPLACFHPLFTNQYILKSKKQQSPSPTGVGRSSSLLLILAG